ncbi:MAG: biotin--[Lachnospira sp.]|nr:biotin--[acetyl-CoA-carboxylase] ligase [Lachnospira sp.]
MYDGCVSGIVSDVIHFTETDSTNNQAKCYGLQGVSQGTLFIADRQTAGRGRRGRTWISGDADGLWMSLLIKPDIKPECASMLTLVTAMAVAETIRKVTGISGLIKWPNDIVIGDRKVCGILTEMSAKPEAVDYIVIGVGINVNSKEFHESVKDMATSLYMCCGREVKKEDLVKTFCEEFTAYYEKFVVTCDMSELADEYNKLLVNAGRPVSVESPAGKRVGKALGIDVTGALLVEFEEGTVESITAGEVSVRGLYGYV